LTQKSSGKQTESRATKRARFAGKEKRPGGASPLILIAGIAVALALIGGTVFALTRPSAAGKASQAAAPAVELDASRTSSQDLLVSAATHGHDPYPLVVADDREVRLPLSMFDDRKAHHYTYMHDGRPIEFFVLKSQDGVVRVAFNACDVCFESRRGYTQDGDEMICNNCGRRFPADQINVVHGGCNPSPLDRTVQGDTLVITVEDIITGLDYF
jgi:hypothetical protein